MKKKRNALLVINPVAGKSSYKSRLAYLEEKLGGAQLKFDHFFTEYEGKGKLARYLESNSDFSEIIVMGGDGTLNYAVNEMRKNPLPLSIVSNGTGNDSVKSLHGETDFEKQVEIALHGELKRFDLGICDDRLFVNGVGIGFDGQVVKQMEHRKNKRGNYLDYLLTVMKTVAQFKEKPLHFSLDGKAYDRKILLMTVSNGTTFGGGFKINPLARSDDGYLDLCILNEIAPASRFWHLPKLMTGAHRRLRQVEFFKAKRVTVHPSGELLAHLDGEFLGHPPFELSIVPGALLLRVPL